MVRFLLYLIVFSSLSPPAAIPCLQPLQENISLRRIGSPLLSKRGQRKQKRIRSPAHPQQQAHDGGEDCLKVRRRF